MENPLPRTHSLTRQKWNTGQKWEAALSKSSRSRDIFKSNLSACEKGRSYMSGELMSNGRPKRFLSGELPLVRPPSSVTPRVSLPTNSKMRDASTNTTMRDAATNTDEVPSPLHAPSVERESLKRGSLLSRSRREKKLSKALKVTEVEELLPREEPDYASGLQCFSGVLQRCPSLGASSTTSIQTEKEGSHNRLLCREGESSSFRGKQLSPSLRKDCSSFRKETVSSSVRKEVGSRKKERKSKKSVQESEVSSVASESARESPCSIHYNQAPSSAKHASPRTNWCTSPSSPDASSGKISGSFQWEEAPGKARSIAAAAEMALARKLVRDESLRKLHGASPRSSVDGHGSFRVEKKLSSLTSRSSSTDSAAAPPPKKVFQESAQPRKDVYSFILIEELKAAVVRKQAEDRASNVKAEIEADARSVISEYSVVEQAHIDLVAPAAAKILNREDDLPVLTPAKTPIAAVPFKWEEAPGKPKDCAASPSQVAPPVLSLPPRLLGGCHNPSKEQQAKILQNYSCNLIDMHWTASGNPTPLSRSRDITPTRRDRTPSNRDPTPTKRDITPAKRDPMSRSHLTSRVLPKSGPLTFPTVPSQETVREHHSGPIRSNTYPNYLNIAPKSVSQEFARVTQESAIMVLTEDLEHSGHKSSELGSGIFDGRSLSGMVSQELQIVQWESLSDTSGSRMGSAVGRCGARRDLDNNVPAESRALAKVASPDNPLSPTSILCGPDVLSSQRSASNLSSAYAESSHTNHEESISGLCKSESSTSLESFVDDAENLPRWSQNAVDFSPYRDLGPIEVCDKVIRRSKSTVGVKAIVKFCRKTRRSTSKDIQRKNSAEPDVFASSLAAYFQKLDLGSSILNRVGSQVFPDSKDAKSIPNSGYLSSPLKFVPRSGELTPNQRFGARTPIGSMTPLHVIATCRSPSYRVMATDECFSVFSFGKVWKGTKARQAKWGTKMKRSSRLMGAFFAALKRSLSLKCGTRSLPSIPSNRSLLDRDVEVVLKEHGVPSTRDGVLSLSADHQFHEPL